MAVGLQTMAVEEPLAVDTEDVGNFEKDRAFGMQTGPESEAVLDTFELAVDTAAEADNDAHYVGTAAVAEPRAARYADSVAMGDTGLVVGGLALAHTVAQRVVSVESFHDGAKQ